MITIRKNHVSLHFLQVAIIAILIITMISCHDLHKPSKRTLIGSYVIVAEPFPDANFRRFGNSGIYCPVVFLTNYEVYFCDLGWGKYFLENENTIVMDFEGELIEATIDKIETSYLEISINRDEYVLNEIDHSLFFNNRVQGTYCSYYKIDDKETIEFWRITSDQICLENSSGLRKCEGYHVINGNSIILDSDKELMVFQIAKKHTFDFSGYVLFQNGWIDRFLMSCSATGIEDLIE